MINCHYLRIFCYLAKNLSFILAARDLFTTQPPFTKQVKALEDHLGMKLFNKNGQKVIFTIENCMVNGATIRLDGAVRMAAR